MEDLCLIGSNNENAHIICGKPQGNTLWLSPHGDGVEFNREVTSWVDDYVIPEVMSLLKLHCDSSYLRFTTTKLHKILHDALDFGDITVPKGKWPFVTACSFIISTCLKNQYLNKEKFTALIWNFLSVLKSCHVELGDKAKYLIRAVKSTPVHIMTDCVV